MNRSQSTATETNAKHTPTPKWITEKLIELDAERARYLAFVPMGNLLDECLAGFEDLRPTPVPFDHGTCVYMDVKDLHRVVELMRRLCQRGFKAGRGFSENAEDCVRQYHMRTPSDGMLTLYCRIVGGEGAVCKFVAVGTKEVPVYELKCGDT